MNTKIQHRPNNPDAMEEICSKIFSLIEKKEPTIRFTNMERFWHSWDSGAMKIFTREDSEKEMTGVTIVLLIADPLVKNKLHALKILSLGDVDEGEINDLLAVMKVKI